MPHNTLPGVLQDPASTHSAPLGCQKDQCSSMGCYGVGIRCVPLRVPSSKPVSSPRKLSDPKQLTRLTEGKRVPAPVQAGNYNRCFGNLHPASLLPVKSLKKSKVHRFDLSPTW